MFIIFDLDRTLADPAHRDHHVVGPDGGARKNPDFEAYFAECGADLPIYPIITVAHALVRSGEHRIEIWSARGEGPEGRWRAMTEKWLASFGLLPGASWEGAVQRLRMRPYRDSSPDEVLKERWLDETLKECDEMGSDPPALVFDDRDKVVAMWRRRGIRCAQVAPGPH